MNFLSILLFYWLKASEKAAREALGSGFQTPLAEDAMLSFLSASYVLDTDFANRFIALRDSPKLLETGWPMYLYRYAPAANTLTDSSCG